MTPAVAVDPAQEFRRAMAEHGLETSAAIVADGRLRRFHVEGDRRGSLNGWFVLYPDNPAAGAYGSWRNGMSASWCGGSESRMNEAEQERFRRRMEEARATRLREERRRHAEAQGRAREIWQRATPASSDHPYLVRKRVSPGIARQQGMRLVLPVQDLDGNLWSLQFIDPHGGKLLLSEGRKRGNCIPISGAMQGAPRVLICEGFATGATLAQMEPAALVLAAIDAGNLAPVAVAARNRWGGAEIVVCCDADEVGITKGRAAAIAASADIAIPTFPEGAKGSDFNDLANASQEVSP